VALAKVLRGLAVADGRAFKPFKSWLSRLLDVARLPEPVVAAFSDTHDITVRVARDIRPLTGDPKALAKMREEAERIEEERSQKGLKLSGPEVAKRLVKKRLSRQP
jgi:ParB family chromosome partitioning protein